jgi:organic radical activating enzyme
MNYHKQTQQYSTFGNKLLRHTDVLYSIQKLRKFIPITVQLAPTEACDMDCSYCSVKNNKPGKVSFDKIAAGLNDFKSLGAKSLEITGGGNPLLYRDNQHTINDIINIAHELQYKIGVITNSTQPLKRLSADKLSWIRVSLSGLDQGCDVDSFDFEGLEGKLGLSYIVNSATTPETIESIKKIVDRYSWVKFVRVAPDCLQEDSLTINDKWGEYLQSHDKIFIKEIGENFKPYCGGCYEGMIRPYWTFSGVYICTSHVLNNRCYDDDWKLCEIDEVIQAWGRMNERFQNGLDPYDIDINKCYHCYYANNNEVLNTIINPLPDEDFA